MARRDYDYKEQHFVPDCYLQAWCDPNCPAEYIPYVWLFDRDGSNGRKKAPANIFKETDFYTIKKADGTRDLTLEHGLAGLETKFSSIRKNKLDVQKPLTAEEHVYLAVFVAAGQFRTRSSRDHHAGQWQGLVDKMDELEGSMRKATPERRRAAAKVGSISSSDRSLDPDHIRLLAARPLQMMMPIILATVTPVLVSMNMLILTTDDQVGFITSDTPVTWFDPEAYKLPPFYRAPALGSPTIEVTMPLSPRQCLVFSKSGPAGYAEATVLALNELNRRHRALCDKQYVIRSNSSNPYWFTEPELPDDAWEKRQELKERGSKSKV
jgi:hypothetical protein